MTKSVACLHLRRIPAFGLVVGALIALAGMTIGVRACFAAPVVPSGPPTMRLISAAQYVAAIHDVFGEDIKLDVSIAPPQREHGRWRWVLRALRSRPERWNNSFGSPVM